MDRPALSVVTYDVRTRDKELQKIQGQLRLTRRILEYLFLQAEEAKPEQLQGTIADAILCQRHSLDSLNRHRAAIVTRKISPNLDLKSDQKPTLFEAINGANGFTAFVEQATKERKVLNEIRRPISKRQKFTRSVPSNIQEQQLAPVVSQSFASKPDQSNKKRSVFVNQGSFSSQPGFQRGRGRGRPARKF